MYDLTAHLWWISALASSLFFGIFFTINQYLKQPGSILIFWRGFIPFLALTPVLLFIDWPTSPVFYAVTLTTALIVYFTDRRMLQGSALYGGGVTTRMTPFIIWLVFLIWFMIHPEHRAELLSDIPRLLAILLTMAVGVFAATNMRKCAISQEALIYFLPNIVLGALLDVLNKTAMDHSVFWGGVVVYAWIQGVVISAMCLARYAGSRQLSVRDLFNGKVIAGGIMLGICVVFVGISKNIAMSYAVNPAYVSAIIFTAPFWVSLYYKATGHKEIADVRSGMIFVLSAIVLVLLNS